MTIRIAEHLPFRLRSSLRNQFSLVTAAPRPGRRVPATQLPSLKPPPSAERALALNLSPVNHNPPAVPESASEMLVKENAGPGALGFPASMSHPDSGQNSLSSYSLVETQPQEAPICSYVSINSQTSSVHPPPLL